MADEPIQSPPSESAPPASPPPDPESRIASLEAELAQSRAALAASERARSIQIALHEAGVSDADSASLLVAQALGGGGDAGDGKPISIHQAVADLKRRKPHLFARPASASSSQTGGAMGAGVPLRAGDSIADLARAAAATGDRKNLLRYLRARRGA